MIYRFAGITMNINNRPYISRQDVVLITRLISLCYLHYPKQATSSSVTTLLHKLLPTTDADKLLQKLTVGFNIDKEKDNI